jgi:hypothetical protein
VVTPPRHNGEVSEEGDSVGVLVVRVWFHEGSPVMRLTTTPDVVAVEPVSLVVGTREALHQEIDRWLHEMAPRGE